MVCFSPYWNKKTRTVCECGHCAGCIDSRSKDWVFRISKEMEYSKDNLFVTLTYNKDNLPEGGTLNKVDVQNFLKRFREHVSRHFGIKNVRYFECGEYGDKNDRAHYHLIFFGIPFSKQIADVIDAKWVYVKPAIPVHAPYVSSYVLKNFDRFIIKISKVGRRNTRVKLRPDGRLAPFFAFSRGIGKDWLKTVGVVLIMW